MAKVLHPSVEKAMWEELVAIQETFPYTEEGFLDFANYSLNKLIKGGPDLTETQADICKYLFHNGLAMKAISLGKKKKKKKKKNKKKKKPKGSLQQNYEIVKTGIGQRLRMIQANRGLGKTTLCAIYAVFRIIHDPTTRVLIFSAGGKLAGEIAKWIIQILEGLTILQVLLPDKLNGDRCSMESYDIHWVFRGTEKAPSVKCLGVDSNAQGSRADLLIADDIESMKNSRTVLMRELLVELTKEFESICQSGDIVYLGTPQFFESIYNNLPSRGFSVRIWPARYPNKDQLDSYGDYLAPMLKEQLLADPSLQTGYGIDGRQGAPCTPTMFPDELLIEKETSQGPSKFQLQYMLNTRLADAERYPLKMNNLIVMPFSEVEAVSSPIWCNDARQLKQFPIFSNQATDKLYGPMDVPYTTRKFQRSLMYIDPAGGGKNGDETAYAIISLIGSNIYIREWGGVPGGYEEAKMMELVNAAKRHNIKEVWFEKNYGNGAFQAMIAPLFQKYHPAKLEEHWATGQKELRIIDTIEPLLSAHRIIIHPDVIKRDLSSVERYADEVKKTYSGLFQLSMITRDKGCLVHDDRLDALSGAIYQITLEVQFDQSIEMARREQAEFKEWQQKMMNPSKHREDVTLEEAHGGGLMGSMFKVKGWR